MNRKRGLLLVVFLLGLAMVVSVEGGSVCGTWQPNNRCGGGSQLGQTTVSTQSLCKFFCEGFSDTTCCSFTEGEFENTCRATKATGFTSGSSSQSAMLCDPIDDDDEEAYDPEFCNPFSSTRQCSPDDDYDEDNDILINRQTTKYECLQDCDETQEVTCCMFMFGNTCLGIKNSHSLSHTPNAYATICPRDPHNSKGACDYVNGEWLNKTNYPSGEGYENNRCCFDEEHLILNNDMICFWNSWLPFETYCKEKYGGTPPENWQYYDGINYNANDVTDGCCGNDPFRCVGPEGCNQILDKNSCNYPCTWQESDLGGIINTTALQLLCLPDNQTSDPNHVFPNTPNWRFIPSNDNKIRTLNISNGDLVYDFLPVNNNEWYTCDAFETDYFVSVDGSDNVLNNFQIPSYEQGWHEFFLNEYICYGHSFESKTSDPEDVFKVQSRFAKCGVSEISSLYKINVLEAQSDANRIRIELSDNGYYHLNGFTELSFFMKLTEPEQTLTQIKFFGTNNNFLFSLPIYKTQDTNVMNWTRYAVRLLSISSSLLRQVEAFYIYDLPDIEEDQISNFTLKYDNRNFYCNNKYWFEDLDNEEHGEDVCDSFPSFGWTGNYCCGDDTKFGKYELYSDTLGGCYKGIPTMEDNLVYNQSGKESHKRFLYYNEKFIGCGLNLSYQGEDKLNSTGGVFDDNQLSYTHANLCDVNGSYVCGFLNIWKNKGDEIYNDLDKEQNFSLSISPDETSAQCCPGDSCWNGTRCVAQFNLTDKKVCIEGSWINKEDAMKYNPRRDVHGFCPLERCYHHKELTEDHLPFPPNDNLIPSEAGGENEGSCVPSHYYVNDSYCLNGQWSSRPMMIASVLLNFTKEECIENYTLLCDNQTNVLRKVFDDELVIGYGDLNLISEDNNVCLLSYYDDETEIRLLGVSGNITAIEKYLGTWDDYSNSGFCDLEIDDDYYNTFVHCDEKNDISLYVNRHMNSLIIQRYNIPVHPLSFFQAFIKFIMNPINAIIDLIKGPGEPINFGNVGGVMLPGDIYDTFYLSKNNEKEVFGYIRNYDDLESGSDIKNYIFTEYKNISESICQRIYPLLFEGPQLINARLLCEPYVDENNWGFIVRTDKDSFDTLFKKNVFNALTSELRISDEDAVKPDFIYLYFNQSPVSGINFSITFRNQSEDEIEVDDWEIKSRTVGSTHWGPGMSLCKYEDDELNCKLDDENKEYRIIAKYNDLMIKQKFMLSKPISFECNIVPNYECSDIKILKLSDKHNAFVAKPDYIGYPYSLCCEFNGVEFEPKIKDNPDSKGYLLSLQLQEGQGKVPAREYVPNVNDHLYLISDDNVKMNCGFYNGGCPDDQEGILSLSNKTESRLVSEYDYGNYSDKLCCKI